MTARRRYKPMPPLTRRAERALRKCIKEKWEPLASGQQPDTYHCALCLVYVDDCTPCPINQRSGEIGCGNTPYDDWWNESTRANAKHELRFLRDTLRFGLAARERAKKEKR